jgi:hypothetical protein
MTRHFARVLAGLLALMSAGCAVYGSAGASRFAVDGDTGRVSADTWEGTVACGTAPGQPPCAAASVHERIR